MEEQNFDKLKEVSVEMRNNDGSVNFDIPTDSPKIIKVIGVGGGGGNAVQHMQSQGIHDVNFVLCNTDRQALAQSDIRVKVQLGPNTTKGLGAGNDPDVARAAAEESREDIEELFKDGTQMVFITAGMGGGTGTGAAPIIARMAKEMDMLTIGIVTIPFLFERNPKIIQALKGVEEMQKNVDALLVINNERLREIYTDGITTVEEAFAKADDILTVATKSITEIITNAGIMNVDFRDVRKVLKDGGVAIMSTGVASGESRLKNAIENALRSPLINNNDISNAKKILFNISTNPEKAPLRVDELSELNQFMETLDTNIEVIWGTANDKDLDQDVKFTVLATGFGTSSIDGMEQLNVQRSQEEEDALAEKEAQHRQMIERAYGKSTDKRRGGYRRNQIYLFSAEDLDNEELAAMIENSPTYNRKKADLDGMKQKAREAAEQLEDKIETLSDLDENIGNFNVIKF